MSNSFRQNNAGPQAQLRTSSNTPPSSPSVTNGGRLKPGVSFADAIRGGRSGGGPRIRTGGRPPSKPDFVKKAKPSTTTGQRAKPVPVPAQGAPSVGENNVVEIPTSSEDEAVILADRPLDPGDSMYRGRAPSKSRIRSVPTEGDRSPVLTRKTINKANSSLVGSKSVAVPVLESPAEIREGTHRADNPRPKPKPRLAKRVKSVPVIQSSDDEMPMGVNSGAEDRLPTMAEIFEQVAAEKKAAKHPSLSVPDDNPFIDTQADQSGSEVSDDEMCDVGANEYDYEDPFIDDSNTYDALSQARPTSRRGSDASSLAMDLDESYPGVQEENPVDMAMRERERRRVEHEKEMDAVLDAAGRHREFLVKALQLLQSNEEPDAELYQDEDRQIALATRDSLLELLGGKSTKRRRSSGDALPLSSSEKGKAKAAVEHVPEPTVDDSDDGLSDYERRNRKRLRTAMELSRRQGDPVVGESSQRAPLQQAPGRSSGVDIKPKVDHQSSPKTPPSRRRQKRGMADLMASAGAEPVSPPVPTSSPPASNPTPSGLFIESRLLAPPPVNEIQLDMSDRVIRLTAKPDLYRLAQSISFKSWNENLQGPGHVRLCGWALQCPDMDAELALTFVVFERSGDFGNLSRMDISQVYCLRLSANATRYHAVTKEGKPFTFLTTGWLESSQITVPNPVGLKQKSVKIITHEGEHQRMSSAACTVFGFDSMKTQYAKHAVQFSTRAEYNPSNNSNATSPGAKRAPAGMFTGASSGSSSRISTDSFSLGNTADVPVYDARDAEAFDVNTDLPNLEAKLPRWREEIPVGSFVVVGFTMTAFFSSSREWTLGLNIQWAIIVGIPGPDSA